MTIDEPPPRASAPGTPPTVDDLVQENARLRREAKEAASRIEQLTAERERLVGALDRSNLELDQLAYVTSHNLKAPLRGMGSLAEWLEEDLGPGISPEARQYLGLIRERVHRLEALIDGVLRYARAGRARVRPERFDAGALIAETVERLALPGAVRVTIAPEMPTLVAERALLQQVFRHLLENAVGHFKGEGPRVEIRCSRAGPFWQFSVTDDGPGIAPGQHARIWGMFQKLAAPGKGDGSGIGLSVVEKIVTSRGGRVWVESALGQGATFHFTWPADPGAR